MMAGFGDKQISIASLIKPDIRNKALTLIVG